MVFKKIICSFLLAFAFGLPSKAQYSMDTLFKYLNINVGFGWSYDKPFSKENQTGRYLSNRALLNPKSFTPRVSIQYYRPNSFGFRIQVANHQTTGSFAFDRKSKLLGGEYFGEFPISKLGFAYHAIYNREFAEKWMVVFLAGMGYESNAEQSSYKFYDETFLFVVEKNNLILQEEIEIRRSHNKNLGVGFYLSFHQAFKKTAELFYRESEMENWDSIGQFRGTGFGLGFRINWTPRWTFQEILHGKERC